jgi:hypothetical protein
MKHDFRYFPILPLCLGPRVIPGGGIPWEAIQPHGAQAIKNHKRTLLWLAARGGLSWCEAYAVLTDSPWRDIDAQDARNAVQRLVSHIG